MAVRVARVFEFAVFEFVVLYCKIVQVIIKISSYRLVFMFKIVQGLVPAIDPSIFLIPQQQRRRIKPTTYKNHQTTNILHKHVTKNSNCFQIPSANTEQFKNSFFPQTVIDWNHLTDFNIAHKTVESFRSYLLLTLDRQPT